MDAKARIEQLVADATAGLRDDAELRLDVRAELASHIEEAAAAHEAEGKSPDEALALALKGFGPVADVAAGLVVGNRRRMKLRALARLAVRALLVPAAVVVALVVCSRVVPLRGAINALGCLGGSCVGGGEWELDEVGARLPEDKAFLFTGDKARPTDAQRQRSIWEAHPESKVWYGNYITHLLPNYQSTGTEVTLELVEEELRRGERLDPDNARYNLLLAGLWADKASELVEDRKVPLPDGTQQTWMKLVVKDRALLDRAMAEMLKAVAKRTYSTHSGAALRERLDLLAPVRSFEEELARIAWAAGLLLPDCAIQRNVARTASLYGQMLADEGRVADAQPFLDAWYPLVVKYNDDAFTLIELLVGRAIVKLGEQYGMAAYEKLGLADKAAQTRARAQRLDQPFEGYMSRRKNGAATVAFEARVERGGSILDKMLLPALDPEILNELDLTPGRRLEHVLVEQAGLSLCLLGLVGLMMLSVVATLRWRWARGMDAAPLLLLPDWGTMARIVVLGVLVPLGAYFAYTRWSGLAGREFGFSHMPIRFLSELVLLGITIVELARSMATRAIRRRCESLGVGVPSRSGWRAVVLWAVLAGLWLACLGGRYAVRSPFFWGVVVVATLGAIVFVVRFVIGRRGYGLYCGTVARSLIPVFAAAAIVVGVVAQPYLRSSEIALVQAQSSLSAGGDTVSFTRAEALMVERLKAGVRQAARDLAPGT